MDEKIKLFNELFGEMTADEALLTMDNLYKLLRPSMPAAMKNYYDDFFRANSEAQTTHSQYVTSKPNPKLFK